MIKFFRHLRQRLLTENRFSKYVIYALGEIVLVVIGILIALQINNRNERLKKNSLKNEYVISLRNDFTKDTIQLNNRLRLNRQVLKELNSTKNRIKNGSIKTAEDFKNLFKSAGGGKLVRLTNTYNTNSFNLLISSGNIGLLNRDLSEGIMELNRLQNFEKAITINNRDYFFEFMFNLRKYPIPSNPYNTESLENLMWKGVDLDALPRDLTTYLGQYEFTINRYIQLTEQVVVQTEKVLNLLHQ